MSVDGVPLVDTRAAFAAAVKWGFETAVAQGARRIVCCDGDFAAWPLADEPLLQALSGWLRLPQRRLVLLARSYDDVPRRFPRFVAWRRDWAHAIETWQAPEELAADLPALLVAEGVGVHLIDAAHWRGRASLDVRQARLWTEQLDVVLQRSERAFAANTLGL
jgi:hypothetical protein